MAELAKMMILFGIVLIVSGFLLFLFDKIPGAGRLPGDIVVRKGNFSFYFPLATSLLISFVLTLIFNFLGKK